MLQLLTDSQVQVGKASRFLVELASIELELDGYGEPVPASYKRIDVVVAEPTLEAIASLLQAAGHLEGYELVSHWVAEDCDCF